MNYLELVNDLIVESGVSGEPVDTVKDHTGETRRLVKWVRDAWEDIQLSCPTWAFLKVQASMPVPLNATLLMPPEYAVGQVAEWDIDSFRMAEQPKGRSESERLRYEQFDWFRDHTMMAPIHASKPQVVSIDWNNESLYVHPPNDKLRTLFYDYWRTPQILVEHDDVPLLPAQYHRLIVWHALLKYGTYDSAAEVIVRAQSEIGRMSPGLWRDQGPGTVTQGLL